MPKLHLVGITPDNRGLMLSEHARAKRGDLVLEINDELLDAIERAERLRRHEEGGRVESAALPSKRYDATGGVSGDRLTPREIQDRLRAGETVAALAKSSGLEEAWIERFAAPVLGELERVVGQARTMVFSRQRAGASAVPLGQAVTANLLDKGVTLTLDDIDAGWRASQRPEGGWRVIFSYSFKGRRHTAEWDVDLAASEVTARNKLAGELAYRESDRPGRTPAPAAAPAPAPAKKPAKRRPPAKKAGVPTAPAEKAPGKPAPPKAETRTPEPEPKPPESQAASGLVRQTLPGTSTEKPAASTLEAGAPPAPAESAPAEAAPAEEAPAERPRRTDPLGRRALFSAPGTPVSEEVEPAPGAPEGEKASPAEKAAPAGKRPAARKTAPAKNPPPAGTAETEAPPSEPPPPSEPLPPSAPVPEPPAG